MSITTTQPRGLRARLGWSVAVHGEQNIVGAPGDEKDLVNSGSVFIYQDLDPIGWTLLTKLRPPTPEPGQAFGSSLDLSADRLVVGSPYDNLRGVGAGAAHLFQLDGFVWEHELQLAPTELLAGDQCRQARVTDPRHALELRLRCGHRR